MRKIVPFLFGVLSGIEVNLVGTIYLGELFFIGLAPFILFADRQLVRSRFFQRVSVCIILSLVGYVISDLYRDNRFENYSRGWAGLIFLLVDFVVISSLLYRRTGHIAAFVLGYAGVLVAVMGKGDGYLIENWKFGWAMPVTILVLVGVNGARPIIKYSACVLLALIHVLMDYRSLGLVIMIISGLSLLTRYGIRGGRFSARAILFCCATVLVLVPLITEAYLWSQETNVDVGSRRDASNAGRAVGIELTLQKISESPVIGWGSWASTAELDSTYALLTSETSDNDISVESALGSGFRPHSQILQAWYEGGLVGMAFFIYLLIANVRCLIKMILIDELLHVPLLYWFLIVLTLWNLFASPFGGGFRILIAIDLVILFEIGFGTSKYRRKFRFIGTSPI